MDIYAVFFKSEKLHTNRLPSEEWLPAGETRWFDHVEIHVNGHVMVTSGKVLLSPDSKTRSGYRRLKVKLNCTEEDIMSKITYLRMNHQQLPYRGSDALRACNDGLCIRSYFKTGFICSTFSAYLLGYEDYYQINIAALFKRLTGQSEHDYVSMTN